MLYINNRFNSEKKQINIETYVPQHVVALKELLSEVYFENSNSGKPEKFDKYHNSLSV